MRINPDALYTCDICGKTWLGRNMAFVRSAPERGEDGLVLIAPAVCDECDAAGIW